MLVTVEAERGGEELRAEPARLELAADGVDARDDVLEVRVADDDLSASDLIIPPDDLSLEEAKELFSGEGLIPDLPVG